MTTTCEELYDELCSEWHEKYLAVWRDEVLGLHKIRLLLLLDHSTSSLHNEGAEPTWKSLYETMECIWEELHTVCWSETPAILRVLYGKIMVLLVLHLTTTHASSSTVSVAVKTELIRMIDIGILLGDEDARHVLNDILDNHIIPFLKTSFSLDIEQKAIFPNIDHDTTPSIGNKRPREESSPRLIKREIPTSSIPLPAIPMREDIDLVSFYEQCFLTQNPLLLTRPACIHSWPAMQPYPNSTTAKWGNVEYLLEGRYIHLIAD